ncbi:MAG: hypothetical protein MK231_03325, partial [Pelagibacterales bacterium]|nr:hypothetical protein [Pelagibacterales bacterium]
IDDDNFSDMRVFMQIKMVHTTVYKLGSMRIEHRFFYRCFISWFKNGSNQIVIQNKIAIFLSFFVYKTV